MARVSQVPLDVHSARAILKGHCSTELYLKCQPNLGVMKHARKLEKLRQSTRQQRRREQHQVTTKQ